jgi:hypothetical protein
MNRGRLRWRGFLSSQGCFERYPAEACLILYQKREESERGEVERREGAEGQ